MEGRVSCDCAALIEGYVSGKSVGRQHDRLERELDVRRANPGAVQASYRETVKHRILLLIALQLPRTDNFQ